MKFNRRWAIDESSTFKLLAEPRKRRHENVGPKMATRTTCYALLCPDPRHRPHRTRLGGCFGNAIGNCFTWPTNSWRFRAVSAQFPCISIWTHQWKMRRFVGVFSSLGTWSGLCSVRRAPSCTPSPEVVNMLVNLLVRVHFDFCALSFLVFHAMSLLKCRLNKLVKKNLLSLKSNTLRKNYESKV